MEKTLGVDLKRKYLLLLIPLPLIFFSHIPVVYSWWNATYGFRYEIISDADVTNVIAINNTHDVGGTIIWTNNATTGETIYLYCENSGCGSGLTAIANDTDEKFWLNESYYGSFVGNSPAYVYDLNTLIVYNFGERTGTALKDSATRTGTFDGTASSDPAFIDGGLFYYSSEFDGNDNWNLINLGLTREYKTISLWVKYNYSDCSNYAGIFEDEYGGLRAKVEAGFNKPMFYCGGTNYVPAHAWHTDDTWYMLTLTWNNTGLSWYKNGTFVDSHVFAGYPDATQCEFGAPGADGNYILGYGEGDNSFYTGLMDEFRIYNRTLTSAEILEMYQNGINNLLTLGAEETPSASDFYNYTKIDIFLNGTLNSDKYYQNNTGLNVTMVLNITGSINLTTNMTNWVNYSYPTPLINTTTTVTCTSNNTYYYFNGTFAGNTTHNSSTRQQFVICWDSATTTTTLTTTTTTTLNPCEYRTWVYANPTDNCCAWGSPSDYNDTDYGTSSYTYDRQDWLLLNYTTNGTETNGTFKLKYACGEDTPDLREPIIQCWTSTAWTSIGTITCSDTEPHTQEWLVPQACLNIPFMVNLTLNQESDPDDNATDIYESEFARHYYNCTTTTTTTTTSTTTTMLGGGTFTEICNANNLGNYTCGGIDFRYVLKCARYNITGTWFYDWDWENQTYCKYGCYNGACIQSTQEKKNLCFMNETRCGGIDNKYVIPCNDTDGDGYYEWEYRTQYWIRCNVSCINGQCVNFPIGSPYGTCEVNSSQCIGSNIIYCRDVNNDGNYEWDNDNVTFCKYGCQNDVVNDHINATCKSQLPEHSDLFKDVTNIATIFLNQAFKDAADRFMFVFFVSFFFAAVVTYKLDYRFGLVTACFIMFGGILAGWIPYYIAIILLGIGGGLIWDSKR